jgi:hypothetical protein
MIIDTTYFFGDIYVPQVTETSVANSLNKYIAKYEPEFLQRVLGYEMGKNISSYPDIINGKEFNDSYIGNQLNKWIGLKVAVGNGKYSSIIANYVYVKYMSDNISFSTGSGEKIIDQGTSETVSPSVKLSRAWNAMADNLSVLIRSTLCQIELLMFLQHGSLLIVNLLRKMNAFGI